MWSPGKFLKGSTMATGSTRMQRLFDLISVLWMRGRTTVFALAEDLTVSTRTIHRDLASLVEVGGPVVTVLKENDGRRITQVL